LLDSSSNNTFYHNSFINNTQHVHIETAGHANSWDNGYPSGGNYWSDYNGTEANHDGIGDTPYVIDANNIDNYPLMTQYVIPEYPSIQTTMFFILLTLLTVIIYKKKGVKTSQS
jgi:nitrous oxidase accessory protein NosD